MAYKAVFYGSSLYHFNKNHSPKDGRFTFGDGDGDGVIDDHKHQKWTKTSSKGTGNNDSERLATAMTRYANTYVNYRNASKTTYIVDDDGNVLYRDDGSPRFIMTYDTKKKKDYDQETENYLWLKKQLQKKYSDVTADAKISTDGESVIKIQLVDKDNNRYVTELKTTYEGLDFDRYDYLRQPS